MVSKSYFAQQHFPRVAFESLSSFRVPCPDVGYDLNRDRISDGCGEVEVLERAWRHVLTPPTVSHPCFATRLGGVPGGKVTQGWRCSSHTATLGAGKLGSAKLPMATAMYPGKPSPSQ
jgi:hypothetical protein